MLLLHGWLGGGLPAYPDTPHSPQVERSAPWWVRPFTCFEPQRLLWATTGRRPTSSSSSSLTHHPHHRSACLHQPSNPGALPRHPGCGGEGEATSTLQQQAFQVDVQQQQQQQAFQASARPGPVILNVGQSNEDFEPMESSYPSSSGRYQQPAGEGGAEVGAGAAAGPAWLAHHPKALSNLVEPVHSQRQPAHAHAQYSFKKTAQVLRSVPFLRDWGGFL